MTPERLCQAVDESRKRTEAVTDAFLNARRSAMVQSILACDESRSSKIWGFHHVGMWPSGWEAEQKIFEKQLTVVGTPDEHMASLDMST